MIGYLFKNAVSNVNSMGNVYGIKSVVFYHDYIAKHADKYLGDRDKDYIKTIINCMISSNVFENMRMMLINYKKYLSYLGDKIDNRFSQNKYYLNFNRVYFLISKVYTEITNELGLGKGEKR